MTFRFSAFRFPFIEFVFMFLDAILSIDISYIIVSMLLPSIDPFFIPPVLLYHLSIIIIIYLVKEGKNIIIIH